MKRMILILLLCLTLVLCACGETVSVVGSHWNELGELILEMSDGTTVNAGKHEENPQGLAFHLLPDDTWSVSVGNASQLKEITVPSIYRGKPVTHVAEEGFIGAKLIAVSLPDSIKEIGALAFAGTALQEIVLPTALERIGDEAFRSCSRLTAVTLPAGLKALGEGAFTLCSRLVEIQNLSALTLQVGEGSELPVSVENLYTATEGRSRLLTLDGYVFFEGEDGYVLVSYNGTESELVLPSDCNGQPYTLREGVFYDCDELLSVVVTPDVTCVPATAFALCDLLQSVRLPDSVTSIAREAFTGCVALTELNIPLGVTELSNEHFRNCKKLLRLENEVFYVDKWAVDANGIQRELRPDTVGIGPYALHVWETARAGSSSTHKKLPISTKRP